jgi:hypothetical protein
MTTAGSSGSTVLVSAEPLFTVDERAALAGFLAGYSGLTRDAYTLDLRQYISWCIAHGLHLFTARRADIEGFGRDMEATGRARATIARRLCTIAGVLPVLGRRGSARALPSRARAPTTTGPRVARGRVGPQRRRRAAGRGRIGHRR